jgi:hypothetical protein
MTRLGRGFPVQVRNVAAVLAVVAVTGTIAVTEGGDTAAAAGNASGDGIIAVSNAPDTSSAAGTSTVAGTIAVTNAADTSSAAGTSTVAGTIAVTNAADTVAASNTTLLYPNSVSGRKILDQNGNVWLDPNLSAWGMSSLLTNAQITSEMPRIAARGFKSIVVWIGGTEDGGAWGTGWHQHQNATGQSFWTGTPWGSTLGAAWASVDHMVTQAAANGIFCWLSFCDGNSSNKNGLYFDAVTNTNMYNAGVALATRYASATNVGWHIMLDNSTTVGSTRGQRLNALFDGINDTEGTSLRPVRWMEVDQTQSTDDQGWYDPTGASTDTRMSVNCMYEYGGDTVPQLETLWADTSGPSGDCEPPYVGSPHYTVQEDRQYRQRNYSVFIEGGCLINFGHEDYWHFTADGLFTDGVAWTDVLDTSEVIEASYCWGLVDQYCKTSGWGPTSSFVTTGETNAGDGVQKAAQGTDGASALAYFPTNRTVVVDTTILTGTSNVRLRWFDPVAGTYSTIAASEAQQTGRSVTLPAARGDGSRDFVLVADLDPSASGAVTNAPDTAAAAGAGTVTGTSATTNAPDTATAAGAGTVAGTIAVTEGGDAASAAGTSTVAGTIGVTEGADTSSAAGTPVVTGTIAVTNAPDSAVLTDDTSVTGAIGVTNAADTGSAAGTPVVTGTAALSELPDTATAVGSGPVNGTLATTNAPDTSTAAGASTLNGTIAAVNAPDVGAASEASMTVTGRLTLVVIDPVRQLEAIDPIRTLEDP